jgi:Ca2+-binding RTX toxin-like protein
MGLGAGGDVYPAFNDPRGNLPGNANPIHREYHIELLDHDDLIEQQADVPSIRLWGDDYIAGGAGEDEIFGQLGADVIQGDGKIGTDARTNIDPATGQQYEWAGPPTDFGADRAAPTGLEGIGDLTVRASFEAATDGDDYIEGNGGNDVIFGNLGQDDIVGGSSDLYGLTEATQRPDGNDIIFGGAGTDIARNHIGDATTARSAGLPATAPADLIVTDRGGHAHDADTLVGDNGRILRLVGVNGVQRAGGDVNALGVWSSGGFLNFNYDVNGTAVDGYGSDGNATTYDRIIARAVQFLDYHEGGIDVSAAAAGDRGGADELHGESGDDTIYGQKGNDILYGEGQDDDLVGGYGNDWISGGTGADGVIGDDGRIIVSRNAIGYGEALHGVSALLPDNGDTKTFNGNMINEWIATPGTIQEAIINVAGELKKAVNLTPFSFDTTFNGNQDEFTSVTRKTVDDQGRPGAHNSDDIIFGGLGSDWLHGGSGDDAILGGEALGEAYTQVYNAAGVLVGIARSDYRRPFNPVDVLRYNPIDPDGWHADRTRRSGEFALYDEYDPLRKITLNTDGTANKDDAGGVEWFLNFSTTEGTYVPAGVNPKPVGQTAGGYAATWNDGTDRIFGDTGNDWLVGGTGRDDLYAGFGNDLLNADDDQRTNLLRNDQPDTQVSYEDRAFGGAGRDVLIANTGGDRLIDWVGEFNSYLVPFAPFGMATVSRTLQPQLAEFLYTLSASDGADPTRWADTNGDATQRYRNGEPEGELGVIRQKDFAWQAQTGAPADPQAGNIPGGKRDVLRTANFNDGSLQALAPDSGTWQVSGGTLQVAATSNKADAVAVYQVGDALPSYF